MKYNKVVTATASPTRYTKIIRHPGAGTKYNRTYQEVEFTSRYTKTVAAGSGAETPPPDGSPPIVATKAQWDIHNRYQVGQEISAYSATWRKGDPANEVYRSRWQTKAAGDDGWNNTSWDEHANQQVKFSKVLAEGVDEVRFQTQVRDTTKDPAVQVNSFASLESVISLEPLKNETKTTSQGNTVVGSTLTGTLAEYSGGLLPVSELYQWQRSDNGTNGWSGVTSWTEIYTFNETTTGYTLVQSDVGDYLRFASKATDSSGEIVYGSGSSIGPVVATTIGLISLTVDDVPVVWGEAVHVPVNTPVHVVATISGDANPNYKWEARGDYPLMVGSQTATTTLTFPQEGGPTVTLTATDSTATDSPINYAMNFYVASQVEWDALHPTTTN